VRITRAIRSRSIATCSITPSGGVDRRPSEPRSDLQAIDLTYNGDQAIRIRRIAYLEKNRAQGRGARSIRRILPCVFARGYAAERRRINDEQDGLTQTYGLSRRWYRRRTLNRKTPDG
jgi:hypothetical protein